MKKRLLTILFALTAMLCCIFGLSACGKDEPKKEKDEIAFTTLLLNEDNAYTKEVSNDTTEFSFVDEIKRFGNANFVVSSDKYGSQTYLMKIVPLQIGDNEFYILESVNEEVVSVYKVVVRRRPMYTVAFDTDGGTSVESQRVEENGFAVKPAQNPTWNDFTTFTGWDFDFTTPITEDITIKADWVTSEECFTADGGTITGVSELFDRNSKKLYIPYTINGVTITEIGDEAFLNCSSLTSVIIPNGVTSIGGSAFQSCNNLTSVVIPNSVTSIGSAAFAYCSSLTSVVIPNSVTSIGGSAFQNCSSLTSVVIPDSVISIGAWAFSGCSSLTSVVIPDSVRSIGSSAFYNCGSLTSVIIGDSVTIIGYFAFYNCSNLTIYCEAESAPSGWDSDWNSWSCPVVWGYKENE